jgi:hypothetical protein
VTNRLRWGVLDCSQARKTAESELHAADYIWGSLLHLKGNFHNTGPRAVPTENLVIRRQYHKQVLLLLDIQRSYDASVDLGH